ncbi:hypothetical protein [Paenisporosarcina sp. TG20]|uniref:hypothetical protein n=1 Tax=Paenisporosarcina sp. TG20 TaxID=1211706 RepID=UPI0003119397|nr:hypothetical protein [Paenisporosarcina sp. TG20]
MKKLLFVLASLTFLMAACSPDEEQVSETPTEDSTANEVEANPASEMMVFYPSISESINKVDTNLNNFEAAQADDTLPEGAELQTMIDGAKQAADDVVAQLETLEVPEALEEQQESIDSALSKLKESYTMKSQALASEGEVLLEDANELFQEADAEFNAVLEELELIGSSIYNEVA